MDISARRAWIAKGLLLAGTSGLLGVLPAAAAPAEPFVTLPGNHAALAPDAQDLGGVDATHVFEHVLLGMRRTPDSQRALDRLVSDQQDRHAADYHKWLNPADLQRYAPAQADIDRVAAWLRSQGLSVNAVSASGMTIDFSGSASHIAAAFRTPLHRFRFGGADYVANTADVSIPASMAAMVDGVTLSNVFPRPNMVPKSSVTIPTGPGNLPFYPVGPADFATIYNLKPAQQATGPFSRAITGIGVTIAVVEQTDILPKDWNLFRHFFGLSSYSGTLSTLHPGKCGDPGRTNDEGEAALDAEWASANAPDSDIVEASCPATETTFGVMTTLRNLVEGTDTNATIYSISYGGCEQQDGLPFLNMWTNLVEEGAAEGKSIVVSSGDSGASCDRGDIARNGLGVNGLAASGFVTSVGGTDFADTAMNQLGTYWAATAKPGSGYGTALSYVPEIPWNNSCASSIIANYSGAASGLAFCNTNATNVQNGVGGTGGQSLYFAKPSWQATTVAGVPKDGVRDQPDVSFFAANGYWDHAYLICLSDQAHGGAPCVYTGLNQAGQPNAFFQAVGGTSVSTPAFAGILALTTQVQQAKLGNPAPRLYELAKLQFDNPILANSCNASLGRDVSKGCIFNNVTAGDNAEPCVPGTPDCHVGKRSDFLGVLTTGNATSVVPAFPAQKGYSLATGLGSLNVTNLLENY